ncbi:RDD family protein [Nitrosophilus labii]|uniref:RDD family protein n=1 Tax=Nitrosophilus labii TaxID=2706014 RepID=UPI001656BD2E|nr:RDD family protein [Nitrosophilus labii]
MELGFEKRQIAPLQKRAFAFLIDDIVVSVIFLAIIWDMLPSNATFLEISSIMNQFLIYLITIKIVYHTYFVWKFRATLGKLAMKIEVVSAEKFVAVTFSQAFNRAVFRIISEMAFYLGFLLAFIGKNRQAFHDKTAKTVVVNV